MLVNKPTMTITDTNPANGKPNETTTQADRLMQEQPVYDRSISQKALTARILKRLDEVAANKKMKMNLTCTRKAR